MARVSLAGKLTRVLSGKAMRRFSIAAPLRVAQPADPARATTRVITNDAYKDHMAHARGICAVVSNYGGIVQSLKVADRCGEYVDVVLGKSKIEEYITPRSSPYFGAMVGRVANRIRNGAFDLDGKTYEVTHNEGPHHLHGGAQGWDSKLWSIQPEGTHGSQVTMTYNSADGEEGYPGAVDATLVIAVTDDDALQITVRATTSAPTPINVTHHGYFNLRGHDMEGALAQHLLRVNADTFTAVDASNLPTGDVESSNSVFALEPAAIPTLALVFSRAKELAGVEGIDHNFILHRAENADAKAETPAAVLYDPVSGRILKVTTNQPGMQIYTANNDFKYLGKDGAVYSQHAGICFETQNFPDAVNQPAFPNCILRPGEEYYHRVTYRFTNDEREDSLLPS